MNRILRLATMTIALLPEMAILSSAQNSRIPSHEVAASDTRTDRSSVVHLRTHLEWLSQQLGLSNQQRLKLQPILRSEEQQIQEIDHSRSLTVDEKRIEINQAYEWAALQIKAQLTPEQQQKF